MQFNIYNDFFGDGGGFSPFGQSIEVLFEQYVGNQLVNQQRLSAPPMMLQAQFIQACQQIVGQSPMRIRMVRWEEIWNEFEQKMKPIEYSIEFQNWKDN